MDRARDELFSHIRSCGVLDATAEHQDEWLRDTMQYMAERYPGLDAAQLSELEGLGRRYCQPIIQQAKPRPEAAAPAGGRPPGSGPLTP